MKRLISITGAFAVALASIAAGTTAGSLLLSTHWLLGASSVGAASLSVLPTAPLTPSPVGSGFTYQGRLLSNGTPVNGSFDFTFRLYDQLAGGTLVSGPISNTTVVSSGLFTATVDFGASSFNGDARFMEIATRQSGGGSYTTLAPRQPITPAPYALYSLKTKGYKGVVTVAKDGGDFSTVTAALDAITDASATNRYLVWIAPGVYTETVTMKQYVDIEGSGEATTTISQVGSGPLTGTVIGASSAELRFLTARNTGGSSNAIAIYNEGASPSLLHVTATALGGNYSYGVLNNTGSSPTMNDLTASGSGGAFYNYGVYNGASTSTTMHNVRATASGTGTSINMGVLNIDSTLSTMNNIIATASGGNYSYGVYNSSSLSTTMNDVTATGSGSANNYGVANEVSSPTMNNVKATASGGTNSYGIHNVASSPIIARSTASAGGGANNYGIYNDASSGSYTVKIDSSKLSGSANSIRNDSEFTTRIGASQLEGGPVLPNGGTVTCIASYNGSYQNANGFTGCP
jgi:hypothetical protein